MINPEIRRLHMLKRAHAKSKVKIIKTEGNDEIRPQIIVYLQSFLFDGKK